MPSQQKKVQKVTARKKTATKKQGKILSTFKRVHIAVPVLFVFAFAVIGLAALRFSSAATGVAVNVRARGTTGQERIELRIDGYTRAAWTLSTTAQTLTYTHPTSIGANSLRVYFINNGVTSTGADKNAIIDYVDVNSQRFHTEAQSVFSEGSWDAVNGCNPGYKLSEWIACDGFTQYSTGDAGKLASAVSAPAKVDVTARGATGQEKIELRIDGVTYASWLLTTAAKTYTYTHPSNIGANSLRVYFVNNGVTSTGADKNVIIDNVMVRGQRFDTESPSVYSDGSWNAATGCAPGYKSSEWLHCDGYAQYNIGSAGGSVAQAGCDESKRVVAIVAHTDDELLFMNPDIDNKIKSGACVSAIFLTAGDARLNVGYATDRTYGAKSAWAKMVGVNNAWSSSYMTINAAGRSQSVLKATLEPKPGVRLYFMDTPDGYVDGTRPEGSLQKLWLNQVATLPTINPLPAYTRQSLLDTITQLLRAELPAETYIMDATNHKAMDHSDHIYSAQFATQSVNAYKATTPKAAYLGYASYTYKQNVSFNDYDRKMAIYHAYDRFDKMTHLDFDVTHSLSPFYRTSLVSHQYRVSSTYPAQPAVNRTYKYVGAITGINGMCMDIENGSSAEGTIAQVWGCEDVAAQYWRVTDQGVIVDNNENCLDIRGPYPEEGVKLEVWSCIESNSQRWDRTAAGEIKMRNTNLCVTSINDQGIPSNEYGNDLRLRMCVANAGQIWNYPPPVF